MELDEQVIYEDNKRASREKASNGLKKGNESLEDFASVDSKGLSEKEEVHKNPMELLKDLGERKIQLPDENYGMNLRVQVQKIRDEEFNRVIAIRR